MDSRQVLQLLIVDDHPFQVDSIEQVLMEHQLPFLAPASIHKAYSAEEALTCLSSQAIDILITDIRMPEMSGIELIEQIRAQSSSVKCVLLSGYAEFEYAQKAMELHTSRYLMKPVNEDELVRTVRQLHDEIAAERLAHRQQQKVIHAMREYLPAMREHLLRDLVSGKSFGSRTLARRLESLELPYAPKENVLFFAVQLEDDLSGYNAEDNSWLMYATANIAEELFQDAFHIWHCTESNGCMAFVLKPRKQASEYDWERMESRAKDFQRNVYRYLKHMISIGILKGAVAFPEELPGALQRSKLLFRNREDKAAGLFAVISDLPAPRLTGAIDALYQPPSLSILLETARWNEARQKLSAIFGELEDKWADSPEYAQEVFYVIAGSFQFIAHNRGMQLSDLIGSLYRQMLEQYHAWDIRTFRNWAGQTMEAIIAEEKNRLIDKGMSLSDQVREYISRNLDRDLSLQIISDALGFHPAYLSKVFRVETGCTLSDYLLKSRMEHAESLLRKTDLKIYEVAQRIGYQTTHYFIKLFKNYFGMTPQQYKTRSIRRNARST